MAELSRLVDVAVAGVRVTWQGRFPSEEHVRRFGGVVPEFVMEFWRRVGFSGLFDGQMWVVDPLEWADAGAEMLRGVEVSFLEPGALVVPVARSAFGEVWFWSPGCGVCLSVNPATGRFFADRLGTPDSDPDVDAWAWFTSLKRPAMDIFDVNDEGLFARALGLLGPVGVDECYGFVPSLLFGLAPELGSIQKVKVREHLKVLDMIRRGEFEFEAGPPVGGESVVAESVGVDDSAIVESMAAGVVGMASREMQEWEVAVATAVKVGDGSHAIARFAFRGDEVQVLAGLDERAEDLFLDGVGELAEVYGDRWEGVKLTVVNGGGCEVEFSYDRRVAARWVDDAGVVGSVPREELIEVLRPR